MIEMLQFDSAKQIISSDLIKKQQSTGCEHYCAIDSKGTIYRKKGGPTSVHPEPALEAAYTDPAERIVYHHSHPDERSLSIADLKSITNPGGHEIWVHCVGGSVYGAILLPGIIKSDFDKTRDKANGNWEYGHVAYNLPSVTEADFHWFSHLAINRAFARKGYIEFMEILSPNFQGRINQSGPNISVMEDWFYNLV